MFIVHDNKTRMQWRLAVVERLILGRDNLIRAAHIRMGTYRTTRPIVKLYPLEVSSVTQAVLDNECTNQPKDTQAPLNNTLPSRMRPRRNAALKASQKISEWATMLRPAPEDVEY